MESGRVRRSHEKLGGVKESGGVRWSRVESGRDRRSQVESGGAMT